METLLVDYLRAMLYLFSIYNIISISIIYWKSNKRLFIIHIIAGIILLLNFIRLVFVHLLFMQWLETIIFDYGMTLALFALNIFAWRKIYSTNIKNNIEKNSNNLLEKINIEHDSENDRNLYDILNYQ